MLSSFEPGFTAAVIGASGGIGRAVTALLAADPAVAEVRAFTRSGTLPQLDKVRPGRLDLTEEASLVAAAEALAGSDRLRLVFVASGLLHDGAGLQPEKNWAALDGAQLLRAYQVNAVGPALLAKHLLPLLPREGKAVFAAISARVGSIEDNALGGWYGYRASKAALNMLLRNLAIELGRRRKQAICVGLHPGTVDTALSKPFQGAVQPGKLFTPEVSAGHLLKVIDGLIPADSGQLFAWDGQRIPF